MPAFPVKNTFWCCLTSSNTSLCIEDMHHHLWSTTDSGALGIPGLSRLGWLTCSGASSGLLASSAFCRVEGACALLSSVAPSSHSVSDTCDTLLNLQHWTSSQRHKSAMGCSRLHASQFPRARQKELWPHPTPMMILVCILYTGLTLCGRQCQAGGAWAHAHAHPRSMCTTMQAHQGGVYLRYITT